MAGCVEKSAVSTAVTIKLSVCADSLAGPAEIAVAQGHLEGSNVNAIDTLVSMIEAQRAFEIQSKITMTEDEMLSKSVNKLPQVSG